jgi:AraC family transcriptional regulator, transcriptional activator of pobA
MKPLRMKSISEFLKWSELPPPEHPLITVLDYAKVAEAKRSNPDFAIVPDYYTISVKRGLSGKMRYGQQEYDFDEGIMYFMAPGQVLQVSRSAQPDEKPTGWIMLIHPDFFWNTSLAKTIRQYEFFDYSVNEALFLSDKEETTINSIIQNIKQEYHGNIDKFSQNIIVSHIETLLNYAERFYQRQFITRKITNHRILERMEKILNDYFANEDLHANGLPTVQRLAEGLNVSPKYLSSLLKVLTGQTAQQHIHEKLIESAKEKLSTTDLSVSEIAYTLGFEHPQSFSKFFKLKTKLSPLQFKQSFN